jgi:hypothetical protein
MTGKTMPKMENWLTMRNNTDDCYTVFFDKFVVHVVGSVSFRNKVAVQQVSSFVTIGDEAFALLVLENSEERWFDMSLTNNTKSKMRNKYTDGGTCTKTGRSRTYKGWSNAGLNRFNELFRKVKADRDRTNNSFEGLYLQMKQNELNGTKKRKRRVEDNWDEVVCDHIEDEMADMVQIVPV